MVTPISVNTAPIMADPVPTPVKGEATVPQTTAITSQVDKQSATKMVVAQDTVALSSTALHMSKSLNDQNTLEAKAQKEATKQKEQPAEEARKAYTAAGKRYPPFLGDGNELKTLKQSSPALYREVLRMIVPTPLDLSYVDMQILQSDKGQASRM